MRSNFLCISTILLAGVVLTDCAERDAGSAAGSGPVVAWARENAVPLPGADAELPGVAVSTLQELIGPARVVFLGESRHDAGEQFEIKRRLIEVLVERMGFDLFVLEESLPGAIPVDRWVLGGEGDPERLLNDIGAWYIWDTPEVLDLVRWMRPYNETPGHSRKIRFFGMDIADARRGIENVVAYLKRVDPGYATSLSPESLRLDLFSPDMWPETMERFRAPSPDQLEELGERYRSVLNRLDERAERYADASSAEEHAWARRQAWNTGRAIEMFTRGRLGTFREAGEIREDSMVENLLWLLERAGPESRMIVWAHNVHVARGELDFDIPNRPPEQDVDPLGARLTRRLGGRVVSIGFAFDRGTGRDGPLPSAPAESIDGILARVGRDRFLLDLGSAPERGPVRDWLRAEQTMRAQGGTVRLVPSEAFDALLFTETVSAAIPSPLAAQRFEQLAQRSSGAR